MNEAILAIPARQALRVSYCPESNAVHITQSGPDECDEIILNPEEVIRVRNALIEAANKMRFAHARATSSGD